MSHESAIVEASDYLGEDEALQVALGVADEIRHCLHEHTWRPAPDVQIEMRRVSADAISALAYVRLETPRSETTTRSVLLCAEASSYGEAARDLLLQAMRLDSAPERRVQRVPAAQRIVPRVRRNVEVV